MEKVWGLTLKSYGGCNGKDNGANIKKYGGGGGGIAIWKTYCGNMENILG